MLYSELLSYTTTTRLWVKNIYVSKKHTYVMDNEEDPSKFVTWEKINIVKFDLKIYFF